MKKNNVRIKDNITFGEQVAAIEKITEAYFDNDNYVPYYGMIAKNLAIVTYFIDGLEFDADEDVLECISQDGTILNLIDVFTKSDEWSFIEDNVNDIIEFEKERIIHSHANMDKIIEACDIIIDSLENFAKLSITGMTKEDMVNASKIMQQLAGKEFTMDDISEAIKNAVGFDIDKASAEIIDAKNKEIKELKKYKTLWESRNIVSES